MRNTYCQISLTQIKQNYQSIKNILDSSVLVCAVVKADAYGHGMVQVAQSLEESGVHYFAVALPEEGKTLRENNIQTSILVLGGLNNHDITLCIEYSLTITASSIEKLCAIETIALEKKVCPRVHLKIDTGMGRIGVNHARVVSFLEKAKELSDAGVIDCEGIYTHFADSTDYEYTKLQFDRFQSVLQCASSIGLSIPIAHACSSRALFLYPEFHLQMVRPGIALYGIEPETEMSILPQDIAPVLTLKTEVVYFKVVDAGESVGYGRTWQAPELYARVVTLPIGYADGYPRRLSNVGSVIIRDTVYPVVGRVCMDQMMVSLGSVGESYTGDEVVLIGSSPHCSIRVEDIARLIDATPHEITTCISDRVSRVYI